MKKKLRLKTTSCLMALILLLNAFPVVALDTGSQTQAEIEVSSEETPSEDSKVTEEEYVVPPKYENYTLEKLPQDIKDRIDLDENVVGLDIVDAENPDTITVINSDGTKTLTVFAEPIKYVDEETDKVQFISDELSIPESGDNAYECVTNSKKLYFPKDISKGVLLTQGEKSITMTPVATVPLKNGKIKVKKIKLKKKDFAQYEGVFGEGTSVQYTPTANGLKENIVLNEYGGVNEFSYIIDAKGLVPDTAEGTTITFTDPNTEEAVFKIDETFIYDSRYNETELNEECVSYDNYYKVEEQKNGKYLLTTVVDKAFLESPDTVYPVTVDPAFSWASASQHIQADSLPEYQDTFDDDSQLNIGYRYSTNWRTWIRVTDFERFRFINPDLVVSATVMIDFMDEPTQATPIYFGTSTIGKSITSTPDWDECFSPTLTVISNNGVINSDWANAVDITNTFKEWLVSDIELGEDQFTPGFVMYVDRSVEEFFEIDMEYLPFITVNFKEDCTLEDNLYYIKSGNKYLFGQRTDDYGVQVYWEERTSLPTKNEYKWHVYVDEEWGLYVIESYATKYVFRNEGTDVTLREDKSTTDYRWRIVENTPGSGLFRIISSDVQDDKTIDSLTISSIIHVETHSYTGDYESSTDSQNWKFVKVPAETESEYSIRSASQWPEAAAKSEQNLLYGLLPEKMEYNTKGNIVTSGNGTPYAYVEQTVTNGATMTDGSISGANVDLRSYTLQEQGESGYIRYIDRNDCSYRDKGELYLDIVYNLGQQNEFNSIWFATNTQNNYYKVGAFEVYISATEEELFYNSNLVCDFDETDTMWSGVMCVEFSEMQGRYIGIRITQGVLQKPDTDPWTSSEAEHAYARIRDIAVFDADKKKVEIQNYYDDGMLKRWNTTDDGIKGAIGILAMQDLAYNFFSELEYNGTNLGIELNFTSPEKYESEGDRCAKTSINATECNCTGEDHVKEQNIRADFNKNKPHRTCPRMIPVLWTGHVSVNDYDNDGIIEENEVIDNGAVTINRSYIVILNRGGHMNLDLSLLDFASSGEIQRAYLHELCHAMGASDSYCLDKYNGNCENDRCATCYPNKGYAGDCIMANLHFDSINVYDYNDLLCDKCKEDIYNFLNQE